MRATAYIRIHRPEHPDCDDDGDLEIVITGAISGGEEASHDSPGYAPDVDVDQGPYELDEGRKPARYVVTELDLREEARAAAALLEANADDYDPPDRDEGLADYKWDQERDRRMTEGT